MTGGFCCKRNVRQGCWKSWHVSFSNNACYSKYIWLWDFLWHGLESKTVGLRDEVRYVQGLISPPSSSLGNHSIEKPWHYNWYWWLHKWQGRLCA
jgi:hypothetical protein